MSSIWDNKAPVDGQNITKKISAISHQVCITLTEFVGKLRPFYPINLGTYKPAFSVNTS